MISYAEKGFGLHEKIEAAGHWLAQQDGVWASSDDVAVQKLIDEYQESGLNTAPQDVDAERDRRIDAGVEFYGVMYQSGPDDRENISDAFKLASMAVMDGAQEGDYRWSKPDEDFAWIATDNSLHLMDAPTVVEFGKAAVRRKQALVMAGRQLKDMQPTPADFADDKWWP